MIDAIHATGDIKKFQIYEGTSLLLTVPIAYLALEFYHISPEIVMCIYLFVELFTQGIRIWIVLSKYLFPIVVILEKSYIRLVYLLCLLLFHSS